MKFWLLIVVAVAVLLPSSAEGRIVSRCEVRDQLRKTLGKVDDKTLAIVICEVEKKSHLNTSLVTMFGKHIVTTPMAATPKPTGITAPSSTRVDTTKPTRTNSTTNTTTSSMHTTKLDQKEKEHVTAKPSIYSLYGLFQLSDRQFCDSGFYSSTNECQTSCTSFTDDDITDDTACVIKTGYWKEIEKEASVSCRTTLNFFKHCK